jgi:hypothetical protein
MSRPEHERVGNGSVDDQGPSTPWQEMGVVATFLGLLVGLLTFGGVALFGTAIAPKDKHGAVIFGAVLLGLAAMIGVAGVILALRRVTVREPPPRPRPQGKVEL